MRFSWKTRTRKKARKTGGSAMSRRGCFLALLAVLLLSVPAGFAQSSKPKRGSPTAVSHGNRDLVRRQAGGPRRGASGEHQDEGDRLLLFAAGRLVLLSRSEPGRGLQVSARLADAISSSHTLSAFNTRKDVVINLKIENKK